MPEFTVRRLTTPTEFELNILERILDISGKDDPVSKRACGDNPSLSREYHLSLLRAGAVGGHLLVVCYEHPDNIVGCTACFGPGTDVLADAEQRGLGFDEFMAKLSPETLKWWETFLPQYAAVADSIIGPGVKLASWSLNYLAVDPNFRGRGAGRALVEAGEALARKDHVPMIFETESEHNTKLYKFWGYEIVGEQELDAEEGEKMLLKVFKKEFN